MHLTAGRERARICWVFSAEESLNAFLVDHLEQLSDEFEISLVLPLARNETSRRRHAGERVFRIPILRRPSALEDLRALLHLSGILGRESFDLVHSFMPKAGLLVSLARASGAPFHRIHTFTGQVWASRVGVARLALMALDRVIASQCDLVVADSMTQAALLAASGITPDEKATVLGEGSFTGVSLQRFARSATERETLRRRYGLPQECHVVVFLGRINRDKGIRELAEAMREVAKELKNVYLALVGPDEEGLGDFVRERSGLSEGRLLLPGHTQHPEDWLALADVFCLPSYREGFGTSVIEAAAAGVPAVATRIPGLADAVVDGETGILVPPREVPGLAKALTLLLRDTSKIKAMGESARRRAERSFSRERSIADWRQLYRNCLAEWSGA